ncbi:uncharacterized protein CDV56_109406 [Aspergillus thermomutatus]|uniref:Xylanolytic transcriptional activator regulatory domain-containing protein n=1 Tax=Aspergillus thermomutatus TaxID=41047 RepID=A0A397I5Q3_ASPTH|nr:uncharacterized protein CDV56_109406 [Aspergillus thermomutatus]RHZ68513.1 hypothetical protein CDV56_109406 [Aspergillus thermomutatus]
MSLSINSYTDNAQFLMDAGLAIPNSKNLSLPEAANIGIGVETAALRIPGGCKIPLPDPESLHVLKDEWAVVLGGASNVGRFGIELSKLCGYKVVASCGAKSVEVVVSTDGMSLHAMIIGVLKGQSYRSVNATSRDFHGITSSTSFANLLLSLAIAEPLPKLSPQPLPSRHEITPLLRHYFDNLYTQLPFFVETSFWTSVDAVYQSGGRFAKPFDHWILRLVLATSSASTSYQPGDGDHQRALSLISGALKYAEEVLRPGSVVGIQGILLLAQYSFLDPNHFRSWYLVGTAVRAMIDLGLHQDPPLEVLSTPDRLDVRRIVYHCVYCLDRGVSTALERTLSFSDESVNVALPSVTTAPGFALADSSNVFLHSAQPAWHMVKIRQIMSTAYQNKYYYENEAALPNPTSTWSLCYKAQEWLDNAPQNTAGPFTILYTLESLYTTVIILSPMHRFIGTSDYSKVLLFERCMDYIRKLHQILETPSLLPLMTYHDIQRAYQVSSRFLDLLDRHSELVLNPSVPPLPNIPFETPEPPIINNKDRVNCHARAIVCLDYTQDLLQYCLRKWGIATLLDTFQAVSASARKRLMQSPAIYIPGAGPYVAGPPLHPSAGGGYPGYDLGHYGP